VGTTKSKIQMNHLDIINNNLIEIKQKLKYHQLYENLTTTDDIKIFMQNHVFAVWDYMSLLKSLQINFTVIQTPWIPSKNPELCRFINEIVWREESDVNENGEPKSHFEMYREAMIEAGADISKITDLVLDIQEGNSVSLSIERLKCITEIKDFLNYTFDVIRTKQMHKIAAAFTFGRESLIPYMFYEILSKAETHKKENSKFWYYLKRHIEVDRGSLEPLATRMIEELWQEVQDVAKNSLEKRLVLWDGILSEILKNKKKKEKKFLGLSFLKL
jgi:Protein of unknown function (DUF3050)